MNEDTELAELFPGSVQRERDRRQWVTVKTPDRPVTPADCLQEAGVTPSWLGTVRSYEAGIRYEYYALQPFGADSARAFDILRGNGWRVTFEHDPMVGRIVVVEMLKPSSGED